MIIHKSSYTDNFPKNKCTIKVAVKQEGYQNNDAFDTEVFDNAIYDSGFVSIDGGDIFYLAYNFMFHKLKRKYIK